MHKPENKSLLDINPIYSGEKSGIDFSHRFFPEKIRQDIVFEKKAHVFGRVSERASGRAQNESYLEMTVTLTAEYKTFCARCAARMDETLSVATAFGVAARLEDEENEDYLVAEDGTLDIGSIGEMLLMLNLPFRSICFTGCKGLCAGCGVNLNDGSCVCKKEQVDPRLEILKKLLDKEEN